MTAGSAAAGDDLCITSGTKCIVVRWKAEGALTYAPVESGVFGRRTA